MGLYVSMYSKEDVRRVPRDKILESIGIIEDGKLIQPPRCIKCDCYALIIELEEKYIQCSSCGKITRLYEYKVITTIGLS